MQLLQLGAGSGLSEAECFIWARTDLFSECCEQYFVTFLTQGLT